MTLHGRAVYAYGRSMQAAPNFFLLPHVKTTRNTTGFIEYRGRAWVLTEGAPSTIRLAPGPTLPPSAEWRQPIDHGPYKNRTSLPPLPSSLPRGDLAFRAPQARRMVHFDGEYSLYWEFLSGFKVRFPRRDRPQTPTTGSEVPFHSQFRGVGGGFEETCPRFIGPYLEHGMGTRRAHSQERGCAPVSRCTVGQWCCSPATKGRFFDVGGRFGAYFL